MFLDEQHKDKDWEAIKTQAAPSWFISTLPFYHKCNDRGGRVSNLAGKKKRKAYSFQLRIRQRSAVATIAGVTRGRVTLRKAPNQLSPSTIAASSSCLGISSNTLGASRRQRGVASRIQDNEPKMGIEKLQILKNHEHREDNRHRRKHAVAQDPKSQVVPPGKSKPGKRIRCANIPILTESTVAETAIIVLLNRNTCILRIKRSTLWNSQCWLKNPCWRNGKGRKAIYWTRSAQAHKMASYW